jgi:hypothetical protein
VGSGLGDDTAVGNLWHRDSHTVSHDWHCDHDVAGELLVVVFFVIHES